MTYIVHRVTGLTSDAAVCGADLLEPSNRLGGRDFLPGLFDGEQHCAAGCYAKHRADLTPGQIRLRDVSVPLTVPQHRAEVAA